MICRTVSDEDMLLMVEHLSFHSFCNPLLSKVESKNINGQQMFFQRIGYFFSLFSFIFRNHQCLFIYLKVFYFLLIQIASSSLLKKWQKMVISSLWVYRGH